MWDVSGQEPVCYIVSLETGSYESEYAYVSLCVLCVFVLEIRVSEQN